MSNARVEYLDFVDSVRQLGGILGPALEAQFEAPPGARPSGDQGGVPNPTLATVADPRRLALSDEIRTTARVIRQASALIGDQTEALNRALARWEGQEGSHDQ